MKIEQEKLRQSLITLLKSHQAQAEKLKSYTLSELNTKANPESWSALECIEHLNRYGQFYLPEVRSRLNNGAKDKGLWFRSSWLGAYFAKSMWPNEKLNRMKTFASMNPNGSELDFEVLERFTRQMEDWIEILGQAKDYNWRQVKTSISISKVIKLRLGDTLRVVFYHNERHLRQAFRAVAN